LESDRLISDPRCGDPAGFGNACCSERSFGLAAKAAGQSVEPSWIAACQRGKPQELGVNDSESFRKFRTQLRRDFQLNSTKSINRNSLPTSAFGPWADNLPESAADGILDDTTYDGFEIANAMLQSGGFPFTVSEHELIAAHKLVQEELTIDVSPTGTAAVAGVLALTHAGEIGPSERVGFLLTGVGTRTAPAPTRKENIRIVGPNDRLAFF
jgi:hypothetical protein